MSGKNACLLVLPLLFVIEVKNGTQFFICVLRKQIHVEPKLFLDMLLLMINVLAIALIYLTILFKLSHTTYVHAQSTPNGMKILNPVLMKKLRVIIWSIGIRMKENVI